MVRMEWVDIRHEGTLGTKRSKRARAKQYLGSLGELELFLTSGLMLKSIQFVTWPTT